jgi:hypothetical protein
MRPTTGGRSEGANFCATKWAASRASICSKGFVATFDALRLNVGSFDEIRSARDFDLLEMKVTDKHLPNFPAGFFFGMTENEEMLLKVFKGKYFLCLVSLNPQNPKHCLVDWDELKKRTQQKRIQHQINLARQ